MAQTRNTHHTVSNRTFSPSEFDAFLRGTLTELLEKRRVVTLRQIVFHWNDFSWADDKAKATVIRKRLGSYTEAGLLKRAGQGEYAKGEKFDDPDVLGQSPKIVQGIYDALWEFGGYATRDNILEFLDRRRAPDIDLHTGKRDRRTLYDKPVGEVAGVKGNKASWVDNVLDTSHNFNSFPAESYLAKMRIWSLHDVVKVNSPLAGTWLRFELGLSARMSRTGGVVRNINEAAMAGRLHRARINTGLRLAEARERMNFTVEEFCAVPGVLEGLGRAILSAPTMLFADYENDDAERRTIQERMALTIKRDGREQALRGFYEKVEAGDVLQRCVDAQAWIAFGEALRMHPGCLSRGGLLPVERWSPTKFSDPWGPVWR